MNYEIVYLASTQKSLPHKHIHICMSKVTLITYRNKMDRKTLHFLWGNYPVIVFETFYYNLKCITKVQKGQDQI